MKDKKPEMECGVATMTTPVEFSVSKSKYMVKLKDRRTILRWNDNAFDAEETEALINFIKFVYKAGFADGGQTVMNKQKDNVYQESKVSGGVKSPFLD